MRKMLIVTTALVLALGLSMSPALASDGSCHDTGAGLTAHYINEVPDNPLDVTCDVGVFLDETATVDGVELDGTTAGSRSVQYGVYVDGAAVDVVNSSVSVEPDYPHQFVSIAYRSGASGTVADNTVTGAHRAGILIDGAGTQATVSDNTVRGIDPKADGWAQNGIQVSQGATGTVVDNTVENHWWDKNDFLSSGIILFGANDVTVQRNTVRDNDAGMILFGDRNNAIHNTVEVTREEAGTSIDTLHYGLMLSGQNNGVRHNTITAQDGEVGVYVFTGSVNTKLVLNTISGWAQDVFDGGDETKRPAPFS